MIKDTENSYLNKDRSDAQPEKKSKTILVTIHGTGAGDPTKDKNSWWQEESDFLEQLGQRLELSPEQVKIVPFLWEEGPNSEASRRKAGKRLYKLLRSYDDLNQDYYLIGHSHGGSVAYHALLQSVAEDKPLKGLKCWCTVGTPFLEYKRNKFLFQRITGWRLGLYIMTFTSFVFTLWAYFNDFRNIDPDFLLELDPYFLLFWPLVHVFFLVRERRRGHAKSSAKRTWFTEKQKKMVAEQYFDNWLGLCHPEDEAVSALTNIKDINERIMKPDLLMGLIPMAKLIVIAIAGMLLSMGGFGLLIESFGLEAFYYLIIFIILGVLLAILGSILKVFLLLIGTPLAWKINKMVWAEVKTNAWGDDLVKESISKIAAYPANFDAKFAERMPEIVAAPLREHSSKSAIKTLVKVREILGMTVNQDKRQNKKGAVDLRSNLSSSLTWEELIHTSYFAVDNFIDLVAIGLHRAGFTELKNDFVSTPEREQLSAWYDSDSTS